MSEPKYCVGLKRQYDELHGWTKITCGNMLFDKEVNRKDHPKICDECRPLKVEYE